MSTEEKNEYEDYDTCSLFHDFCKYNAVTGKFNPLEKKFRNYTLEDDIKKSPIVYQGDSYTECIEEGYDKKDCKEKSSIKKIIKKIKTDSKSILSSLYVTFFDWFSDLDTIPPVETKIVEEVKKETQIVNSDNKEKPEKKDKISEYLFDKKYSDLSYLLQAQVSFLSSTIYPIYKILPIKKIVKTIEYTLDLTLILPALLILGYLDNILNPLLASIVIGIFILYIIKIRK